MKKVIVGLSGGVDSSVAAYLLKEQGFDVTGIYMVNWHDTTGVLNGSCPGDDDILVARLVARKLGISFETVDFSEVYREKVVNYMFSEYEKGRTPNPDVLCNREVKFDVFLQKALDMGADYVATGHYCRKESFEINGTTVYRLLAGLDNNKDQSYFLCQLSQKQLEKALFPIGNLQKSEVREIADKLGLASAQKKDSQGICFVGKVELPLFLQQKLKTKKGDIILVNSQNEIFLKSNISQNIYDDESLQELSKPYKYPEKCGKKVGEHQGAHFFTIGQRQGLGIGGMKEPPFVISIDVEKNIVYIGEGKQHPGLFRKALFINNNELHKVRDDINFNLDFPNRFFVRIRYRQELQKAIVIKKNIGIYIVFDEYQRGITPGQFAAIYNEDELIASGVINE